MSDRRPQKKTTKSITPRAGGTQKTNAPDVNKQKQERSRSLAEQLLELSNPAPKNKDFDPEDVGDVTGGWRPNQDDQEEEDDPMDRMVGGTFRDYSIDDPKYAGVIVSRKSLGREDDDSEIDSEEDAMNMNSDGEDQLEGDESGEESGEDMMNMDSDEENPFQDDDSEGEGQFGEEGSEEMQEKPKVLYLIRLNQLPDDEEGMEDGEDEEDEEEGEEEGEDQQIKMTKAQLKAAELQRQLEEEEEAPATFNQIDEKKELEKAQHTSNQTKLIRDMVDLQLKMHAPLEKANRLPRGEMMSLFTKTPAAVEKMKNISSSVSSLLDTLLELTDELLSQNPATKKYSGVKRTAETSVEELWEKMEEQNKSIEGYQMENLDSWNSRLILSSGQYSGKKFKALNQDISHQVNNVLSDSGRLISRARTKRSSYRIFGVHDLDAKEDPEIYDDNDFYHTVVRDAIEGGNQEIDPEVYAEHLKESEMLQKRLKKKVNRKGSKGREIR
ncbi:hypothetical protein PROFUN_00396 [Planoprotostelium fungivorum]|uniref:AATF leucine zipper-containing domain-containing protein n=1 Tax=Planoprotostelium fungivorum TaxID=1890364 RepID=A0A2P6NYC3_9EUKA|nr:hypothetical protein PROFUN_00396 [Planoprotostelium fungivorum]